MMMDALAEEKNDEKMEKRVSFDVPKSMAKTLTLGDSIIATVEGKVCCISSEYGDKGDSKTIRIEIGFSKLPKVVTNKADASLRSMMGKRG